MVELSPLLEHTFVDSQFLCGEKPTIADLALVTNIFHLGLADELPEGENIGRWYKAMIEMDGVKKSLPEM